MTEDLEALIAVGGLTEEGAQREHLGGAGLAARTRRRMEDLVLARDSRGLPSAGSHGPPRRPFGGDPRAMDVAPRRSGLGTAYGRAYRHP